MISDFHISRNWELYENFRLKKKTGLNTGFANIDSCISHALPGITTLVGETGLGKSYFTMQVYLNAALKGIPVLLVDKEIGFTNIRTRLLCNLANLSEEAIVSGKFIKDEEHRYNSAVNTLQNLPIYYFDNINLSDVEDYVVEAGKLHKKRVLLVIDSLNRLVSDFDNRRGDIDAWITLLNDLHLRHDNRLNIWVICEKNKQGGTKESSTIDYISELWLDIIPTKDKDGILIVCRKQRNGPKGIFTRLDNCTPFCYKFEEVENVPE